MEWLVAILLLLGIGYLLFDTKLGEAATLVPRKRLCDYYAPGSVFEDIPTALARGVRLLEVHVYADEQDHPVVALHPQNDGYDYALENITFEQVCVLIANDAFPSNDPFILSIVPHTEKTITMNRVAEHLKTTVRRRLVTTTKSIVTMPIDSLKGKVLIASGGNVQGTELEDLVNLSWNESDLRRLTYQQALQATVSSTARSSSVIQPTLQQQQQHHHHHPQQQDVVAAARDRQACQCRGL